MRGATVVVPTSQGSACRAGGPAGAAGHLSPSSPQRSVRFQLPQLGLQGSSYSAHTVLSLAPGGGVPGCAGEPASSQVGVPSVPPAWVGSTEELWGISPLVPCR